MFGSLWRTFRLELHLTSISNVEIRRAWFQRRPELVPVRGGLDGLLDIRIWQYDRSQPAGSHGFQHLSLTLLEVNPSPPSFGLAVNDMETGSFRRRRGQVSPSFNTEFRHFRPEARLQASPWPPAIS